ncbi:MAG: NERD domain-containing protein [Thermoleophilaceae bacterium]
MARMYPRRPLDDEFRTTSERKVFEAIESSLSDEWEAFHASSWILADAREGARDGEIDFVLCHPDKGILCLEVKGGGIECRHGEWYRVGPEGSERTKDPFTQALDHRHALKRKLREVDGPLAREGPIGHAVIFPYATVHQLALAPDAPRQILIDRHEVEDLSAAVERVLDFHRGRDGDGRAPGERGARAVRDLLAPRVSITVPMAAEFADEEEALVELTHEQTMALARMRRDRRMVVTGCAGSGKTTLAVAHAKRLARDGARVLFACFNRGLRDHLRERERTDGVTFQTFHGLCVALANRARVELPHYPTGEAPPPEYWRRDLPDALVEALGVLEDERYDAILVDEAQDLHADWLAA